jgi:hypothetical protein
MPTKYGLPYLESGMLSQSVQRFLSVSDELRLRYILWLVWLARASPMETAPVQMGAAIEALRQRYLKSRAPCSTTLLPKELWKPIRDDLRSVVERRRSALEVQGHGDALTVLENKLENLNQRPSTQLTGELLSLLGLTTGAQEASALQERNRPAHGGEYRGDDFPRLIRQVNALHTLFHRILLKILECATSYIDYSSLGYPVRSVDEPVGGLDENA